MLWVHPTNKICNFYDVVNVLLFLKRNYECFSKPIFMYSVLLEDQSHSIFGVGIVSSSSFFGVAYSPSTIQRSYAPSYGTKSHRLKCPSNIVSESGFFDSDSAHAGHILRNSRSSFIDTFASRNRSGFPQISHVVSVFSATKNVFFVGGVAGMSRAFLAASGVLVLDFFVFDCAFSSLSA